MTTSQRPGHWTNWTLSIKVWQLIVALVVLAILVMWMRIVHQDDEILALIRSDVATNAAGQRTWAGSFVNTNDQSLRDVAVAVDFLDSENRAIGRANAQATELPFNARLNLEAPLPADAVRLRIYSVQWRMGSTAVLMGPFRDPWEFGYLMVP